MTRRWPWWGLTAVLALIAGAAVAQEPAARPPVDAPELARLGSFAVGVTRVELVQPRQSMPQLAADRPAIADRHLPLLIWYPAASTGPSITYHTAMSGSDAVDVPFDVPGLAIEEARVAPGRFPLVILAHGYGNTPEALSWLGENLASKGYVVVAPAFRDPPISVRTPAARATPIARRPLDIAFVTTEVQRRARAGNGIFAAADAERTALIGYSMGGYGVLSAAGAPLDPALAGLTQGVLGQAAPIVPNVRAVVAISPASRFGEVPAWRGGTVAAVTAPTLYIVGSQDRAVGYEAVRGLFTGQVHAPRYLLTFREAGHSIALIGAPAAMRRNFWDMDWFEDAVWRKDRLLPVEAHFITAFLDRYVKGEAGKAAYLDRLVPDSNAGRWPAAPVGRVADYSPGAPAATTWRGFQPGRATGMTFEALAPQ